MGRAITRSNGVVGREAIGAIGEGQRSVDRCVLIAAAAEITGEGTGVIQLADADSHGCCFRDGDATGENGVGEAGLAVEIGVR